MCMCVCVCVCVCVSVCLIVCVHRAMDVPRVAERRRCKEDRQRDRWAGGGNMRDGEGNWKIGSRDEKKINKKMLNRGANTGESHI